MGPRWFQIRLSTFLLLVVVVAQWCAIIHLQLQIAQIERAYRGWKDHAVTSGPPARLSAE